MWRTCSLQCADKRVSRRGDPARAERGITRVAPAFWRCAASCTSGACGSLYKRHILGVRLSCERHIRSVRLKRHILGVRAASCRSVRSTLQALHSGTTREGEGESIRHRPSPCWPDHVGIFVGQQRVRQQPEGPHRNGRIGHVEGGPGEAAEPVPVDKVDHVAQAQAV